MRLHKLLWAAIAVPTQAFAYCAEPSFYASQPSAPTTVAKPNVPYCLSTFSYSQTHTCESWELDAYQRDVEEYVEALAEYADEAVAMANGARQFALDAQSYAKCEAEDVLSQHK